MKKIHLLILKAFIRPFIVTFLIVMFVLLMLFLWKYIDDIIGKGFQFSTIAQLMMYASATNVAMALPLSVLLSSIMTYGTLGENYELVAIKAAGISLTKALYPMVIAVTMLATGAFFFSNYMLPVANLKFYTLLYSVQQQKSASLIRVNVFNNSFPNYTIRVGSKDAEGVLYDIMIYHKNLDRTTDVIFAKQGEMFKSPDNQFLTLKLKDGIRYSEGASGQNGANIRETFTRFKFKESSQQLSLDAFNIKKPDEASFKGAYQMMSLWQLDSTFNAVKTGDEHLLSLNWGMITPYIRYFNMPKKTPVVQAKNLAQQSILSSLNVDEQLTAVNNANAEATAITQMLKSKGEDFHTKTSMLTRYLVEYQKKFTLSAACLLLFFIGAPLGAIIRKGGLGLPVVISVVFFLVYYIISTIGENLAKDGGLSPVLGTWIAIIILTPIGLFLSYKAANDSVLFDMEVYKRFFTELFKKKEKTTPV